MRLGRYWRPLVSSCGRLGGVLRHLRASWNRLGGVLGLSWGRFFDALGASFLWGRFWGHFVDFGSNFRPFWGDEDDDDDDDDVHVRRHENLNLTTYVSLFHTRSPELRAAALAEGLYN